MARSDDGRSQFLKAVVFASVRSLRCGNARRYKLRLANPSPQANNLHGTLYHPTLSHLDPNRGPSVVVRMAVPVLLTISCVSVESLGNGMQSRYKLRT